jgi:hypothetical protein
LQWVSLSAAAVTSPPTPRTVINVASCCATVRPQWRDGRRVQKREYNIEENTTSLVVGELEDKRVEIVIEPGKVVVRWKEGYSGRNDLWIRNLKTDMLWRMVE